MAETPHFYGIPVRLYSYAIPGRPFEHAGTFYVSPVDWALGPVHMATLPCSRLDLRPWLERQHDHHRERFSLARMAAIMGRLTD